VAHALDHWVQSLFPPGSNLTKTERSLTLILTRGAFEKREQETT
jgi:hypothetical protein